MVCRWSSSSFNIYICAFREDIKNKYILCKNCDSKLIKFVKTSKLRTNLKKELNDLDTATKNKIILDSIFYWYNSQRFKY